MRYLGRPKKYNYGTITRLTLHMQMTIICMKIELALNNEQYVWYAKWSSCETTGDLHDDIVVYIKVWLLVRMPLVLLQVKFTTSEKLHFSYLYYKCSAACHCCSYNVSLVYRCGTFHLTTVGNIKEPLKKFIEFLSNTNWHRRKYHKVIILNSLK